MGRLKTSNTPDLAVLLTPQNPIMIAVEQAVLRGHDWSRTAPPVAEQIAVRIAGLITLDLIHAGQRLLEKDISEVLHISRSPVREALRILEREGLVEFEPRRGAIVTAPDAKDLRDTYVVRSALYAVLLRLLMETCPDELEAVFERHMPLIRRAAEESVDAYSLASFSLNLEITQLCSNRLVVDLLTSISLRTLRYVRMGLAANPDTIADKVKTWSAMQRAIVKRDKDLVVVTAQRRIESSRDAALQALEPISPKGKSDKARVSSASRATVQRT